jgi:hypothetical protein
LTALVGANGTGKSSFLCALDLFYTANARYTEQDYYGRNAEDPIIVRVTFAELADQEKKLFGKYVINDELTVEKEMTWPHGRGSQKYFGASMRNPDFQPVRSTANATEMKERYGALQAQEKYASLPKWTKKADAPGVLEAWENAHPEACERGRDDGQFFGFKEVGQAHLERFTRFLFVPAVRDASEDAAEGRGTVFTDLMDLVVRGALAEREEIQQLRQETQERYGEIMDPANLVELEDLKRDLSNTLNTFVPDASVDLVWDTDQQIDIPLPKARISLIEDGYASAVGRAGHGLQRALVLTMLQHLALAQAPSDATAPEEIGGAAEDDTSPVFQGAETTLPNLILGIEEPELYQHPNRQRRLSRVFDQQAQGRIKGVAQSTQVLYATHSPLFMDIERFHTVRLLRKHPPADGGPKRTVVFQATLDDIAAIIESANNKPPGTYSGDTLRPRLHTLMTPWVNEGFFAGVAVLVEGEDDRAAILGMARAKGYDLDALEISVIPCMGKNNLDRPTAIFRQLQIPVYVVWDGDFGESDAKPEANHRLLRLMGAPVEDWPSQVSDTWACFERDLETTLRAELGETLFDQVVDECRREMSFAKKKHAIKCPAVIQRLIEQARTGGKISPTLEQIVDNIVVLASL